MLLGSRPFFPHRLGVIKLYYLGSFEPQGPQPYYDYSPKGLALGKTPPDVWAIGPRYTDLSWSCIDIQVTAAGTKHNTAILTGFCASKHYSKQQINKGHVYKHNGTSLQPINTQMTQFFLTFQYHVSCKQTNTSSTSIASPKQCYMLQISHFLTSLRSMRDRQLQTDITAQVTFSTKLTRN